jgi:hypothetical protein
MGLMSGSIAANRIPREPYEDSRNRGRTDRYDGLNDSGPSDLIRAQEWNK